ncbi:MAG: type II secretion system F family protein [Phycisphaerales bacterium]|nr:type II secretion system F family protein [Phycisphaerales bacterium]
MTAGTYEYKALDPRGQARSGVMAASTWDEAYRRVVSTGLTPVSVREQRRRGRRGARRITLRDVSQFTYQFSVLIEARIPIADGLRSIAREESNAALAMMIEDIAAGIASGSTVTAAMSGYRHVLGDVYVETISAAEKSGNLVRILAHLAEMLDREVETRASLRSALMYPVCVLTALVAAMTFLMIFVVPRFVAMFESRGIDLPLPTRIVIGISDSATSYWWIIAGGIVAAVAIVRRISGTAHGSLFLDRCVHRLPIVRSALQSAALARFAHVFGLSISSGLPLMDCLEMGGRAAGRPLLLLDARRLATQVSQGGRLAEVLQDCPYISGFARRLISAGEQSAELPNMCRIIARHYDREVSYITRNMATLIEPVVVVALAAMVLGLALAIFLPMWNSMALLG